MFSARLYCITYLWGMVIYILAKFTTRLMEGKQKTKNLKEEPTMPNLIETEKEVLANGETVYVVKLRKPNWKKIGIVTAVAAGTGALVALVAKAANRAKQSGSDEGYESDYSNDYSDDDTQSEQDETEMDESNDNQE